MLSGEPESFADEAGKELEAEKEMNTRSIRLRFFAFIFDTRGGYAFAGEVFEAAAAETCVSTATPHNTPLWVAQDKKIFEKYGLDVQ